MTMTTTIATITPAIPPRALQLTEALGSITTQKRMPDEILVAVDHRREGPVTLRNRMVWKAGTEWVAFLDDDDRLLPHHLDLLLQTALDSHVDLVYPWFDLVIHSKVDNSKNPLAMDGTNPFERPFDEQSKDCILHRANFIPVTCLVRREAFMDVGGFQPHPSAGPPPDNQFEDWGLWIALLKAGAKFAHAPERTWQWIWNGRNTSGQTDRW